MPWPRCSQPLYDTFSDLPSREVGLLIAPKPRRDHNFRWPVEDVAAIRTAYLRARRIYREPDPDGFNLTLSAFTQAAYQVARERMPDWKPLLFVGAPAPVVVRREALMLTWARAAAEALEADWESLATEAIESYAATYEPDSHAVRPKIFKAEVARLGVLNGISDWPAWIHSAPNDPRRRPGSLEHGGDEVVEPITRQKPDVHTGLPGTGAEEPVARVVVVDISGAVAAVNPEALPLPWGDEIEVNARFGRVLVSPSLCARLEAINELAGISCWWLTSWPADMRSRVEFLPGRDWPAMITPAPAAVPDARRHHWWKLDVIEEWLDGHPDVQALAWCGDELPGGNAHVVRSLLSARGIGDVLLVCPKEEVGLAPEDVDRLEGWARRGS